MTPDDAALLAEHQSIVASLDALEAKYAIEVAAGTLPPSEARELLEVARAVLLALAADPIGTEPQA